MMSIADSKEAAAGRGLELARVLLVESDVASRLTLQTLLRAGGYTVDVAASAAEAIGKLDESAYELVLTDSHMESPGAGRRIGADQGAGLRHLPQRFAHQGGNLPRHSLPACTWS